MEISDAKRKKELLEKEILNMLGRFAVETGLCVRMVHLQHVNMIGPEKSRVVGVDVTVEM